MCQGNNEYKSCVFMKVVFYEDFMRRKVGCIISFRNQSTGGNHLIPDCNNLKVTRLIVIMDRPQH